MYDCEICGFPHIHHDPRRACRAIAVVSEPISHEGWREGPEGSVDAITADLEWRLESLTER